MKHTHKEEALIADNTMSYQFTSNVSLACYLSQDDLSISKAEKRSTFSFQQLFTEYMMALLEVFPERISEPVDQLAKDFKKKEKAAKVPQDLTESQPDSEFEELN
jgi:hypothetical protein